MAKGVHSKRRKKNKSLQRRVLWEAKGKQEHEEIHKRLMKRTFGVGDDDYIHRKKNAFRYPNDPTAIFPKHAAPSYIDKRAAYIPYDLRQKKSGVKAYKIEEQRQKKEIEDALKAAEDKVLGENKGNIDLSKMDTFDFDIDKEISKLQDMNILTKNEVKQKRREEKKLKMEDETKKVNVVRNKKKKKSKSYYLVNH